MTPAAATLAPRSRVPHRSRRGALLIAAALLAGGIASAVSAWQAGAVLLLLGVLGGLLALPHAGAALARRWTPFHPLAIFTAFCFFGYFLRSMHLVFHEELDLYHIALGRSDALDLLGRGLLIVLLGVGAFYFGYASPIGSGLGRRLPLPSARWSRARVRVASVVCTTFGTAAYAAYARAAGGVLFLATNMEMRSELSAGMHAYFFGIRFLELGLLLRWVAHLRWGSGRLGRATLVLHALAVMVAVGMLGSRAWALEILFMMLVARAVLVRAPRLRTLAVTVAAGLFLFSIYDQYRNLTHEGVSDEELVELSFDGADTLYEGVLGGRNFDMMDNLLAVIHYTPNRLPHLLGSSYAHFFVNFIPRQLWEGKPKGVDSLLAERIYGWGIGGAPPGTLGELYLNAHLAGVVVGMALFGGLARAIRVYAEREAKHPFLALVLGAALIFVGMVTRGSFFQVATVWAMRLVPLILAALFVRMPRTFAR